MGFKLVAVLIFVMITTSSGWVNQSASCQRVKYLSFLQRPFKVELHDPYYEILRPEIMEFNITIRNNTFMDIHYNFLKELTTVLVDFEFVHDSGNGKYDMVFANKTIDLCAFLNNKKSNALFNIAYKMLTETGELPNKCPIRRVL